LLELLLLLVVQAASSAGGAGPVQPQGNLAVREPGTVDAQVSRRRR